jgi:hypothetical protein
MATTQRFMGGPHEGEGEGACRRITRPASSFQQPSSTSSARPIHSREPVVRDDINALCFEFG